jgi:hypothetical protein
MRKSRWRRRCITATALMTAWIASVSVVTAWQEPAAGAGARPQAAEAEKFTFSGDVALWTVAIKPDQTAAFEQVMRRVREALHKANDPVRTRQADGWQVMRMEKPLPDGNIAYVHVVSPVVRDADYTVMRILYDAFPDERQALYEMYRKAFAASLALATGPVVVDLGGTASTIASR